MFQLTVDKMSVLRQPLQTLSSLKTISGQDQSQFLPTKLTYVSFTTRTSHFQTIRMGGGPRTYPGGVSKWQWKRMQAKKAKQLLKARLARERQIYEMRKRAELKAAVSDLERPWEVVEQAAPNLFSVGADEQLKVLADRFQRPGGFDMWSDRDGPELFKRQDRLPSARFFPKGVVHSVKPYEKIEEFNEEVEEFGSEIEGEDDLFGGYYGKEGKLKSFLEKDSNMDSLRNGNGGKVMKSNFRKNNYNDFLDEDYGKEGKLKSSLEKDSNRVSLRNGNGGKVMKSNFRKKNYNDFLDGDYGKEGKLKSSLEKDSNMDSLRNGNGGKVMKSNFRKNNNYKKRDVKDSEEIGLGNGGRSFRRNDKVKENRRPNNVKGKGEDSNLPVYDLNIQEDGSYGIREENRR